VEDKNELIQERIKKLERLREAGIEPYGGAFGVESKTADIASQFGEKSREELGEIDRLFHVAGRVISLRNFGKTAFAHIQDDSGKIQIYCSKDVIAGHHDLFKNLDIGDIIGVSGKLFRTREALQD
jgi:lysyl-tRNA synthetase class 2